MLSLASADAPKVLTDNSKLSSSANEEAAGAGAGGDGLGSGAGVGPSGGLGLEGGARGEAGAGAGTLLFSAHLQYLLTSCEMHRLFFVPHFRQM